MRLSAIGHLLEAVGTFEAGGPGYVLFVDSVAGPVSIGKERARTGPSTAGNHEAALPACLPAARRPEGPELSPICGAPEVEPSGCIVERSGCGVPDLPGDESPAGSSVKWPDNGGPGPDCSGEWIPCGVIQAPCGGLSPDGTGLSANCPFERAVCLVLTHNSAVKRVSGSASENGRGGVQPDCKLEASHCALNRAGCSDVPPASINTPTIRAEDALRSFGRSGRGYDNRSEPPDPPRIRRRTRTRLDWLSP